MVLGVFKKVLGDYNEKELRKLRPYVAQVNEREAETMLVNLKDRLEV